MYKLKNITIALGFFLLNIAPVHAQVIDPKYEAIFIYNFTKYIEWPRADGHSEFIIGILGQGDIVSEMQLMASQKLVGDRKIIIKVFENAENIEHCHLLFITQKKSALLSVAQQKLAGMTTLYVTESPGMALKGADINFISKVNKILFELNEKTMELHNLKVSSDLKKFAVILN